MRRTSSAHFLLPAALLLALTACQRDRPPRYPPPPQPHAGAQPGYYPYPGQPPPGYGHPPGPYSPGPHPPGPYSPGAPPPQAPAPPAPPTLLGTAITGFGVLLTQLPQIPVVLPPLPAWDPSQPFPWVFPFPGPAQPPTPGTPTPGPAPGPTPGTTPGTTPGPAPGTPPPSSLSWPAQWQAFESEVLALTNQRRAQGATCGNQSFGPAGPVTTQAALQSAARGHSQDMATRNYFDHASPEGTSPMQRAKAAGYGGSFVGENIAAGQTSPAEVVAAWVKSPGHCVNLMDPRYRYLGVGYVFEETDQYRHYWTQNFGG